MTMLREAFDRLAANVCKQRLHYCLVKESSTHVCFYEWIWTVLQ